MVIWLTARIFFPPTIFQPSLFQHSAEALVWRWVQQQRLHLGRLDPSVDFVVGVGPPRDEGLLMGLVHMKSVAHPRAGFGGSLRHEARLQNPPKWRFVAGNINRNGGFLNSTCPSFRGKVTRCQDFASAKPKRSMQQYAGGPSMT